MAQLLNGADAPTRVTPPQGRRYADANGREETPRDATPAGYGEGSRTNKNLQALLAAIDNVEIRDQHDLNEFLEGLRKLLHYVAVQGQLAAGEIEAGAKEQAKTQATLGIVGFDIRRRIRRVTKLIESSANHCAQGAADAVKAWHAMERLLDELQPDTKAVRPRGFAINLD